MEDTKSKITSDDIFAMFLDVTEHSLMVDDWVPKGTQMVFFIFMKIQFTDYILMKEVKLTMTKREQLIEYLESKSKTTNPKVVALKRDLEVAKSKTMIL